ncbi:MAG: DUF1800 domain-containing protein [Pseudomonadota bacterium]
MSYARLCLTTALVALSFTAPAQASPAAMTPEEARHLISRTGFGASPAEIAALTGKSYKDGVAVILGGLGQGTNHPMPSWATGWAFPRNEIYSLGTTIDELFVANQYFYIDELSAWWLGEMIETAAPLTERMTLFWHDHFATSFIQDENAQWMANQNAFFRAHATGNFRDLAAGILRDPAMLAYLSNTENFAESPNENLGREYLELFTLGQGRGYTERDVKEAARALTGQSVSAFGSGPAFYPDEHDEGQKTILGQTGRHGPSDLPEIVMSDASFGPYIVEKLWREFVSDSPDASEVARLTALWKDADWELTPLLAAMFLSDAFWDEANRGRLIKSPVELLVGTARSLGLGPVPLGDVSEASAAMGQALFFPPNVAGWSGGTAWITDASAMARATVLTEVAKFRPEFEGTPSGAMMMMSGGAATIDITADEDLRVGQVFALEAYRFEEDDATGLEAVFTLFDVSFGGQTWRSFPIYLESFAGDAPYTALNVEDCQPSCPIPQVILEDSDGGWIELSFEPEFEEDFAELPRDTRAFLAALYGHLPEMIESTQGQPVWQPDPEIAEDEDERASYAEITRLADTLASDATRRLCAASGRFVSGFSGPNRLGLEGMVGIKDFEELDAFVEAREEAATTRVAHPPRTYENLASWVAALGLKDPAPQSIAAHLMALPPANLPDLAALSGDDLVRALLLSPEFQLN